MQTKASMRRHYTPARMTTKHNTKCWQDAKKRIPFCSRLNSVPPEVTSWSPNPNVAISGDRVCREVTGVQWGQKVGSRCNRTGVLRVRGVRTAKGRELLGACPLPDLRLQPAAAEHRQAPLLRKGERRQRGALQTGRQLSKTKAPTAAWPAPAHLFQKDEHSHTVTCTWMLTAALFQIIKKPGNNADALQWEKS